MLSHRFKKIPSLPFAVRVIIVLLNGQRECLHISFLPDKLAFPSFFPVSSILLLFLSFVIHGTLNLRTRRV